MTSDPADTRDSVAFVWENFGPMHVDRCQAVAARLGETSRVLGIEFFEKSIAYDWTQTATDRFRKVTISQSGTNSSGRLAGAMAIVCAARRHRVRHIFFCHYDSLEVALAAWMMRLLGARVFVMSCSKYDDSPRHARREFWKTFALSPYHGALSSGIRSRDYMRFLGIDPRHIRGEYNSVSIDRIRRQTDLPRAPEGLAFGLRDFVVVARLVPKKNLAMLLEAFALYRTAEPGGRRLVLCGSGPLESDLRAQADRLGIADYIDFAGFVQTEAVSAAMAQALALLLPSVEEQFGNVVIEAQALGLPVILSNNCGARDLLVRSGVNGFVIEPDNPAGLAFFMGLLARDETLWARMSRAASASAAAGDSERFAEGVEALISGRPAA